MQADFQICISVPIKYKKCVIKTCFQSFELKISFIRKNFICKGKFGTVKNVTLVTKITKLRKIIFILEPWY